MRSCKGVAKLELRGLFLCQFFVLKGRCGQESQQGIPEKIRVVAVVESEFKLVQIVI